MIRKLTLLAGVGVGYVLGAKAGQERYQQIKRMAEDLMGRPQVQQATESLQSTAGDLAAKAGATVKDTVSSTIHRSSVDLTGTPMEGSPATTV